MKNSKLNNLFLINTNVLIIFGFFYLYFKAQKLVYLFNLFLFLGLLLMFTILYNKKIYLEKFLVIGISSFEIFHLLGSLVVIEGVRLYDFWLINGLFKYDNIVHFWAGLILVFFVHRLVSKKFKLNIHYSISFYLIIILISCGVGAIFEIVEFFGVVFFNLGKEVGNYNNNMIDLIFNLIGATTASIIHYFNK